MACKTCGGTKTVMGRTHWRREGEPVSQERNDVPCPECTTQTFAVAINGLEVRFGEGANRYAMLVHDGNGAQHAAAMNAAVEAREHQLRGAAAERIHDAAVMWAALDGRRADTPDWEGLAVDMLKLNAAEHGAVSGHVACALAFELGREKFLTSSQLRGLIDHLLENGGESSELAVAMADAAGLRCPGIAELRQVVGEAVNERSAGEPMSRWVYDRLQRAHAGTSQFRRPRGDAKPAATLSDEELHAECRRRGLLAMSASDAATYAMWTSDPPMIAPASMPGLQSELRPGQIFGMSDFPDFRGIARPAATPRSRERPDHVTHAFVPRFGSLSGGQLCHLCQHPRQHELHKT